MKQRLLAVPVLGTALRVQARYTADRADALAASIGFFGFLSLFPLVALAVAIVGFALDGDVAAQARVTRTIEQSIPALSALAGDESALRAAINGAAENAGSLAWFGVVGALLGGLRIASGAQAASSVVFRVEAPSGLRARLEQVAALAVVGVLVLGAAALTGQVGIELGRDVAAFGRSLVLLAIAYGLDVLVFLVAYRMFTPGEGPTFGVLLPGSLFAAAGWLGLKLFGTSYITSQATRADGQYGALGGVIGLLLLFYLAGRLYLYGAELAALRAGIDHPQASPAEVASVAGRVPGGRPAADELPAVAAVVGLGLRTTAVAAALTAVARFSGRRGD